MSARPIGSPWSPLILLITRPRRSSLVPMEGDWFKVVTRREGDAGGKAGDVPIGKCSGWVGDVVGEGEEGEIWLGWILVHESVGDGSFGG
jgi:hypothetical protein